MSSDNGKPGVIDWFDVWNTATAIEALSGGTVQLNLSAAPSSKRGAMLLCASFVGELHGSTVGAGASREVPHTPQDMLRLPALAYELLEALDDSIAQAFAEVTARSRRN